MGIMDAKAVLTDAAGRPVDVAGAVLAGISQQVLHEMPGGNSIAWLVWHAARQMDVQLSGLPGEEQVWVSGGWAERLGMQRAADAFGFGDSRDDVARTTVGDASILEDYLGAVVAALIYGAYFVLRSSVDEPRKRGRIAAVYNLFAVVTAPFLLYVLPRQMESLHPGGEGSPAFSQTDLAPIMRLVFYPAVLGFIALFWWIYTQRVRARLVERRLEDAL